MPRATKLPLAASLVACTLAGALGAGCRPRGSGAAPPGADAGPVAWSDADPLAPAEIAGPDARLGAPARVARLDRLLDLFDAARFTGAEAPRESLWDALGGVSMGRGAEATREAEARLLAEALALDAGGGLDDDARRFVAGAITVLSADLGLIAGSEDLSIRAAAYRDVAELGHPRAADNARWRLYDHVRGCLAGAAAAPPERRREVALHSLYVREDSLAPWLDDRSAHAQPPWPAPASLWALLQDQRTALGELPRWRGVLARRERGDAELQSTVLAALPAARDGAWDVLRVPAGTGRPESLAPVVMVQDPQLTIDLGRPQARSGERGSPELARALTAALARDGRGAVLLVAPPMLPSPALNSTLRTLLDARVARVESAVREPRVDAEGDVVAALAFDIVRPSDQGPAALAIHMSRLRVHLSGRGPRVAADGQWLDLRASPADFEALLGRLDRAYPREHTIALTLGDDVLYQQLQDLLRALVGGPQRRFEAAVWLPGAPPPPDKPAAKAVAAEERRVQSRADLFKETATAAVLVAAPLPEGDQKRLEALSRRLVRCLPELQTPLRPGESLDLAVRFEEGRLAAADPQPTRTRLAPDRPAALRACVEEEARGFRLREQQSPTALTIRLSPG